MRDVFPRETKKKKPKIWQTILLCVLGIILFTSVCGFLYFINGPLLKIDENDPKWKQNLYEKLNEIAVIVEDKLDLRWYKWNKEGNSKENLANGGTLASNGKWTIFQEYGDIYRVKNGKPLDQAKKIADISGIRLNATKKGIYYENPENGKIYFIDYNGKNRKVIVNDETGYATVIGDWIYYTNFSDDTRLYRIKLDGSDKEKVIDTSTMGFLVDDEYIYYPDFLDNGSLHRAKLDGTKIEKLNDMNSWKLFITDKYVYYLNSPTYEGELYRISKTGGKPEKLIDKLINGYIVVDDKYIYYTVNEFEKNPGFYKYSIEERKSKKLSDKLYALFGIYEDRFVKMKVFGQGEYATFDLKNDKFIEIKEY